MSNIEQNLAFILSSRYGEDVRQAIHDAIHDCYEDGKVGAVDLTAREQIANLVANEGSTEKDSELVDIRVGKNGQTHTSAGEAVRSMVGPGPIVRSTSDLQRLADAVPNAIYLIGYSSNDKAPDLPEGASYNGVLITLNYKANVNDGTVQIYGDNTRTKFYIRSSWGTEGNFGEWQTLGIPNGSSSIKTYYISAEATPESPFNDIDSFPGLSLVAGEFLHFETRPFDYGVVFTFGENYPVAGVEYGHGAFQLGVGTNRKMYYRFFWNSTWYEWKRIATSDDIDVLINSKNASLSMFETVGVIGDSYASGGMVINEEVMTKYNISWPQILKRLTGVDFVNYSISGATCKTWLTDSNYGKPKVESDNAKQLYLICLGINDADRQNTQPAGTIADMKDNSDDNPDTFFGNYGKILSTVMSKSEKSKIVLVTIPLKNAQYIEYSGYIKSIGEKYNLPVIDSLSDPFLSSDEFQNNRSGGHPLAVAYSQMAKSMKNLIEKIMLDSYFSDYNGDL